MGWLYLEADIKTRCQKLFFEVGYVLEIEWKHDIASWHTPYAALNVEIYLLYYTKYV